jgi:hypothetical protein
MEDRLIADGLCQAGELHQHLVRSGQFAGPVHTWGPDCKAKVRELAVAWWGELLASRPITEAQIRELDLAMRAKDETWGRVAKALGLARGVREADLTQGQYQEAMRRLGEQPDRQQPARKGGAA